MERLRKRKMSNKKAHKALIERDRKVITRLEERKATLENALEPLLEDEKQAKKALDQAFKAVCLA